MSPPLRLLIIDDDPNDAFFIVRELQGGGFEVFSRRVSAASELAAALEQRSWDVMTCDWVMPAFGAEEALAMVRERGMNTPIIVVTGQRGEEFAVTAMKAGAHDFVSKDNLARLVPAVKREIDEARARRERLHTEAALRESEERLRLAQKAAKLIVWDGDLLTGKIAWNDPVPENARLLPVGFEPTEQSFLGIVHPDDRAAIGAAIARAIAEDVDFDAEFRVIVGDGSPRWIESRGHAIRDATGRPCRLLGVALDVTERRRVEAAIEQSRQQFRSLIEKALDMVAVIDSMGTFVYASPSHEAALGISTAELVGRSALDFIHPEDAEPLRRLLAEKGTTPGPTARVDYRFRRRDGSWAAIEASARSLLDDPLVRGVLINSRDVSDRKSAEDARLEVEARLRALTEASFEGIAFSRDGVVVEANGRLAEMLGYAREDLIGKPVLDLAAPQSRDLVAAMVAGRRPGPYECYALHRNGTAVPVEVRARMEDVSGRVMRVTAVRDISDRRAR